MTSSLSLSLFSLLFSSLLSILTSFPLGWCSSEIKRFIEWFTRPIRKENRVQHVKETPELMQIILERST